MAQSQICQFIIELLTKVTVHSERYILENYLTVSVWSLAGPRRRCPPILISRFLIFDILVSGDYIICLIWPTIHLLPPRFFSIERTSPMIALPMKFSMIWKVQHINIWIVQRYQLTRCFIQDILELTMRKTVGHWLGRLVCPYVLWFHLSTNNLNSPWRCFLHSQH